VEIILNGEKKRIDSQVTLDRLLELFSLPRQRIAVEHNREVVSRNDWPDTMVSDGDKIEVVHFVGGG
jgi:thiamine biosynthesis protein ThiS